MLFSFVVPVFNTEKYLKRCVKSILNQTYKQFEVILIDDGSTDMSYKICDEFANKDNRVRVVHKNNEGLTKARFDGNNLANGQYIVSVDSDDYIKNNLLESCYNVIKKYNKLDIFAFGVKCICKTHSFEQKYTTNSIGWYNKNKLKNELYSDLIIKGHKNPTLYNSAWTKIIRKDFLLKHCCKDFSICMGEDFAYIYECMYCAKNIYFHPGIFYYYNCKNNNSMTGNTEGFAPHDPEAFIYIKKQFQNINYNAQQQIDYIYILTIEEIRHHYMINKIKKSALMKELSKYLILNSTKPQITSNNYMNKQQKRHLRYLLNGNIKSLSKKDIFDIYFLIDRWLWIKKEKICKR